MLLKFTTRGLCGLAVASLVLANATAYAGITHRYSFDVDAAALGTFEDSVGDADGTLFGAATVSGGQLVLPGAGVGKAGDHAQLLANGANGINISGYTNATFEVWATTNDAGELWTRYFDLGGHSQAATTNAGNTIFMTPNAGGATDVRMAISNVDITTQSGFSNEQQANEFTGVTNGMEHHLVGVFDGTNDVMSLYIDGALAASNPAATHQLELLQDDFALLGAALYNDPSFNGSINEFRIYDMAVNAGNVQASFARGPNGAAIPEPTAALLLLTGLVGLFAARRRG